MGKLCNPSRIMAAPWPAACGMPGCSPAGKHFPGHEQTGADTHFGFVVDNTPRDTLMNSCLTPFCRAMSEDLASVMVSHVCFPALDDTDTPCSMSAPVIQGVLRGQLGYEGACHQ